MSEHPPQSVATSRIPDFANREEEAEWWDTHSIVDYFDELEPTEITFAANLSGDT